MAPSRNTNPDPEPYDHIFGGHWSAADSPQAHPPARYAAAPGMRYLLPCAVLGMGGLYEYSLVDTESARRWVMAGPLTSYVTHPMLKAALDRVLGIFTPPGTRNPLPQLGYLDEALLWQVEGYETLWLQSRGASHRIRTLVEEELWTLGLLRRLA